jgi:ubiquinone/menaquinone biosynthesis C-methylase UbiE
MSGKKSMKALKKKIRRSAALTDKQRLEGSKFRILNEKLYTSTSEDAKQMFSQSPDLFDLMHRGFTNQAETWPIVPVDEVIRYLKERHPPPAVIADMGCGEAKISASVPNSVHSFDFRAHNDRVTECDMRNTPLSDASVDVVVFVLSLMGTNLRDFIIEARRIIKENGTMVVVEIASRISDANAFAKGIEARGFVLKKTKNLTSFFTWLEFGVGAVAGTAGDLTLKPCIYKRR